MLSQRLLLLCCYVSSVVVLSIVYFKYTANIGGRNSPNINIEKHESTSNAPLSLSSRQEVINYVVGNYQQIRPSASVYKGGHVFVFGAFGQDLLIDTFANKTVLFYGDSTMRKYYTFLTFCIKYYSLIANNDSFDYGQMQEAVRRNNQVHGTTLDIHDITMADIRHYADIACLNKNEINNASQHKFDYSIFTDKEANSSQLADHQNAHNAHSLLLPKEALLFDDVGFFETHQTSLNEEYFQMVDTLHNITLIYLKKHNSNDIWLMQDAMMNNSQYSLNQFAHADVVFLEIATLHPLHNLPARTFEKNAIAVSRSRTKMIRNLYELSVRNQFECVVIRSSNRICHENFRGAWVSDAMFWVNATRVDLRQQDSAIVSRIKQICADVYNLTVSECVQYAMNGVAVRSTNKEVEKYVADLQRKMENVSHQSVYYFDQFALTDRFCEFSEMGDGRHFQRLYKFISFYLLNSIQQLCR